MENELKMDTEWTKSVHFGVDILDGHTVDKCTTERNHAEPFSQICMAAPNAAKVAARAPESWTSVPQKGIMLNLLVRYVWLPQTPREGRREGSRIDSGALAAYREATSAAS